MFRLVYPGSKLKTVDYPASKTRKSVFIPSTGRWIRSTKSSKKVEKTTFRHFEKILGGCVGIVFYDMTTLYFKTGYSKDGKNTDISKI